MLSDVPIQPSDFERCLSAIPTANPKAIPVPGQRAGQSRVNASSGVETASAVILLLLPSRSVLQQIDALANLHFSLSVLPAHTTPLIGLPPPAPYWLRSLLLLPLYQVEQGLVPFAVSASTFTISTVKILARVSCFSPRYLCDFWKVGENSDSCSGGELLLLFKFFV